MPGQGRPRPPGPPAQAHPRPAPPARTGPAQGWPGARLGGGTVDASARRRGDLAACWGGLPPWARVAHPARRGLGWSVQRPVRVAAERDEQAIARWVAEDWPAIKQRPHAQSLAMLPGRVRSFADPAGPPHLGATRGDPGTARPPAPPSQGLDGRRAVLAARRLGGTAAGWLPPRQLRHRTLVKVLTGLHAFLGWRAGQ